MEIPYAKNPVEPKAYRHRDPGVALIDQVCDLSSFLRHATHKFSEKDGKTSENYVGFVRSDRPPCREVLAMEPKVEY